MTRHTYRMKMCLASLQTMISNTIYNVRLYSKRVWPGNLAANGPSLRRGNHILRSHNLE
jgi:hypothetical protein